ncbi:PaaI family thioesterase [Mycolicibacter arupensis]|uniref:Acyl-coenzyme A thioesterase THEM4 n=1 Tax=Mycolicibacter arupensis TaxID=342002 RepID=A0A0F5MS81_9MYCO|nr:PaaI family thioesterase [Mycolicibacter arupensis]KKB97546.1 thioesterase [Mycolicibacter arupensis]MCV7276598.1 PaaI family thioesterase [Mycolicibacter arupensis]OQZ94145.1 thioesterase [Mycolicibacter arupensis]TXI56021.1 MAG: PaaI family thioesterase [Mycolicibacter arupensis]
MSEARPEDVDPDYASHGGFPDHAVVDPSAGFGRYVATMRRLLDLSVSADPDDATWEDAADRAQALVDLLEKYPAPEGVAPAGRAPSLPGMGSLLLPPWRVTRFEPDGVSMNGAFSRFHVGGNSAVHGGVLPLLFDWMFGMVVHAANRPISRTAFLHVDYRKVTPIDTPLEVHGRVERVEGRKAFIGAELTDTDGTVLAQAQGLMVRLLPGQP